MYLPELNKLRLEQDDIDREIVQALAKRYEMRKKISAIIFASLIDWSHRWGYRVARERLKTQVKRCLDVAILTGAFPFE
jgi:chorismate mutase